MAVPTVTFSPTPGCSPLWRRFHWFAGSCAVPEDLQSRLVVVGRIANLVPTGEARCPGARRQHTDTDLPRTTLPLASSRVVLMIRMGTGQATDSIPYDLHSPRLDIPRCSVLLTSVGAVHSFLTFSLPEPFSHYQSPLPERVPFGLKVIIGNQGNHRIFSR